MDYVIAQNVAASMSLPFTATVNIPATGGDVDFYVGVQKWKAWVDNGDNRLRMKLVEDNGLSDFHLEFTVNYTVGVPRVTSVSFCEGDDTKSLSFTHGAGVVSIVFTDLTFSKTETFRATALEKKSESRGYSHLLNNKLYCDVVIETSDGVEINAHRCILAGEEGLVDSKHPTGPTEPVLSSYLKAQATNPRFANSDGKEDRKENRLVWGDITSAGALSFLRFVYDPRGAHAEPSTFEVTKEVLKLAHRCMAKSVLAVVDNWLSKIKDMEHVHQVFQLAILYELEKSKQACIAFTQQNALEMLQQTLKEREDCKRLSESDVESLEDGEIAQPARKRQRGEMQSEVVSPRVA